MDDIRAIQRGARERLLRVLGGPLVTVGLACAIAVVQALHLVAVPNVSAIFLTVLVGTCLTGEAGPTLVNLILTLAATQVLYYQSGRLSFTGTGLVRLLTPLVVFPVVAWMVLAMRRRLTAALEAPVQAERQLFRAVMSSMHDAIVETDWQGIRDVNDSFCRMTGFTREVLIGKKAPFPFWPVEEYATIAAALETSMRGKALDFELVLTRKNGERFPVLLSVSRILDSGSSSSRVLYSFREITELKRAQAELRKSQAMVEQAIEAGRIGTWDLDLATRRVFSSGHHASIFGLKPGEQSNTYEQVASRIHSEDRERVVNEALQARDKGQVHQSEFRVVWPDGTVRWVYSRGAYVYNEKREPVRMSGVVLDVTERRQAEAMLAGQGEILEKIARGESLQKTLGSLVEMIEKLLPGSLCTILTLTSDGRHLHVAAAPHLPQAYNEQVEGFETGMGRACCGEAAYTGKRVIASDIQSDPRWAPWRELAAAYGLRACLSEPILAHDGKVLGTFAVYYHEPTNPGAAQLKVVELAARLAAIAIERELEERELRDAKEAAEIANRTKDRFLNLMSHELRTPLTPILTLASLLERDARLPEEMRADLEMIRRNAEVEAQLVDDLLELVRMAQGPGRGDLEGQVRELRESHRASRSAAKVEETEEGAGKALRILLVEDHEDTGKTLSKMLGKQGHSVTLARTMAEAVNAGTAFDVLLSDIGLPDGSGLEVVKQVRSARSMPAIALSGFGAPEDIRRSLEAGFEMHLTKPVDFQTLLTVLDRVASAS